MHERKNERGQTHQLVQELYLSNKLQTSQWVDLNQIQLIQLKTQPNDENETADTTQMRKTKKENVNTTEIISEKREIKRDREDRKLAIQVGHKKRNAFD